MNDYRTLRDAKSLAAYLRALFPDDEDALADSVEGEHNIGDALYRILLSAEEDRNMGAGITLRIAELEMRQNRFKDRMEKKRELVRSAMEMCNIRKLERPEFTASLANSQPKVIITEPEILPLAYQRVTVEPNKTAIAKDLKDGVDVPGATLANGGTHIVVRRG